MKPFCNLINLFSSINYDSEYERSFWNEIYGCVTYLNLPYDTVMNLPVYIRKYWIQKHNHRAEEEEEEKNMQEWMGKGGKTSGIALNGFAKAEQAKISNGNSFVR